MCVTCARAVDGSALKNNGSHNRLVIVCSFSSVLLDLSLVVVVIVVVMLIPHVHVTGGRVDVLVIIISHTLIKALNGSALMNTHMATETLVKQPIKRPPWIQGQPPLVCSLQVMTRGLAVRHKTVPQT